MPAEKREAIDYLVREHALSICTACRCLRLSRSAWYRPLVDWRARDGTVIEALSGLAEDKPGLGFWKLYDRLQRAGHRWNHKRIHRIYCELRLNKRSRRKITGADTHPAAVGRPTGPRPSLVSRFHERCPLPWLTFSDL